MPIKPCLAYTLVLASLFFGGCQRKPANPPVIDKSTENSVRQASKRPSLFPVSGTLVIPSSNIVLITSPSDGLLKTISFPAGSYVRAGSVLAAIENIEFLKLQQQFLEAKSQYFYYSEDLKRQGGLAIENATSVKKMQQAQLDFQTSEIRLHSLAKQLSLVGFGTDSLDADNLSPVIFLRSPVSGYIDEISIHAGNHIDAGETILILVRKYDPIVVFEVPEEYFGELKTGNMVDFSLTADSLVTYKARLTRIDRQVDAQKHLIRAWATPVKSSPAFIPGMQVNMQFPVAFTPGNK